MLVDRIAWTITTFLFVIVAVTLFLSGYDGYGGVFMAVAAAAAVNLVGSDETSGPNQRDR